MVELYLTAAAVAILGVLYFKVLRPIGDALYETVNRSEPEPADLLSSDADAGAVPPLSSQDGQSAGRTDSLQPSRDELLTLYRVLRKYGVPREEVRAPLKGVRVPLSNDLWAAAAPPEPAALTPIARRPYDPALYHEDEPELRYTPPGRAT